MYHGIMIFSGKSLMPLDLHVHFGAANMLLEPAEHRRSVHPSLEDEKSTPSTTYSKKKKIPMDQSFFTKKGMFYISIFSLFQVV